jgi:hypothetical protein
MGMNSTNKKTHPIKNPKLRTQPIEWERIGIQDWRFVAAGHSP